MQHRPTLVETGNGVRPAVSETPVLATSPGLWNGFAMEGLSLPASELPPRSTLLEHVICQVTCAEPVTLRWRENSEKFQTIGNTDLLIRSQQELVDFAWNKPMDVLVLGIGLDTLRSVSADVPGASQCELLPSFGIKDPFLGRLMRALRDDLSANCPAGPLLGESICTAITAYALQRYSVQRYQFKEFRHGLPEQRWKLVLDYIEAHLGENLSIKGLASQAGVGPHYFRKLFRVSAGIPVHEYVLKARITRAKRLLEATDLSIAEISRQAGFSSQSHFTAEFRRRFKITPAVYRSAVAHPRVLATAR